METEAFQIGNTMACWWITPKRSEYAALEKNPLKLHALLRQMTVCCIYHEITYKNAAAKLGRWLKIFDNGFT